MMSVYFDFWKVAEKLRIRDEYLLDYEKDEEKKEKLRTKIQANSREADECRRKHLDSIPPRRKDWEFGRLIQEGIEIRKQAIVEAKEILKSREQESGYDAI